MFGRESVGDARHFCAGLVDRDVVFESGGDTQRVVPPCLLEVANALALGHHIRGHHVHRLCQLQREGKSRWEHADDLPDTGVKRHRFADDLRIGLKAATPHVIADQQEPITAVHLMLTGEQAPALRLHPQDVEETRGGANRGEPLRLPGIANREAAHNRGRAHRRKGRLASQPFLIVHVRDRADKPGHGRRTGGGDLTHRHDAVTLRERQRSQQHRVHD